MDPFVYHHHGRELHECIHSRFLCIRLEAIINTGFVITSLSLKIHFADLSWVSKSKLKFMSAVPPIEESAPFAKLSPRPS